MPHSPTSRLAFSLDLCPPGGAYSCVYHLASLPSEAFGCANGAPFGSEFPMGAGYLQGFSLSLSAALGLCALVFLCYVYYRYIHRPTPWEPPLEHQRQPASGCLMGAPTSPLLLCPPELHYPLLRSQASVRRLLCAHGRSPRQFLTFRHAKHPDF
jgi:hypothetical protein